MVSIRRIAGSQTSYRAGKKSGDLASQAAIKSFVVCRRIIPGIVLRHSSSLNPSPRLVVVVKRDGIANTRTQCIAGCLIKHKARGTIRVKRIRRCINDCISKTAHPAHQGQRAVLQGLELG